MLYRTLGKTGLEVSIVGFGGSPLGGVFGPVTQLQADRAVRAALDQGINLFDTSPFYGNSEETLGRALRGVPRDAFLLSTKVGRYGPAAFDFSGPRVARSVDESLVRLQADHLDIVHCHDIEFGDPDQVIDEAIPALRQAQTAGKIRAVSVSGLPLRLFDDVLARTEMDVLLSYCHYCLNDDALADRLHALHAKGVGVISASPLAMGLLTESGPPPWHPAPEALKAACRAAATHCRANGHSLPALALAWAVANPGVATTLVGMADEALVRQNVAAALSLPDSTLLAEVQAILAPVHRITWPSGKEP